MSDERATKKQRGDPQALSEILGNESAQGEDRIGAAEELGILGTTDSIKFVGWRRKR